MQKIIIEIATRESDSVVENLMGEKNPSETKILEINEKAKLHYEGTKILLSADNPDICYFLLDFVTDSLAGAIIALSATWFFNKLNMLGKKIILKINGRKTAMSEKAISEAIELAASEPSIEDQIKRILSEIDQFAETIIPLAQKSRLDTEEFFKGDPCTPLWGAHQFYLTIKSSVESKLEEINRLANICNGPITITELK